MSTPITEHDLNVEAMAASLAELLISGEISEDEYHAIASTYHAN
jgi:hypothetical protein